MVCFNTILENEKLNQGPEFEDPNELRLLVKNLVTQTKNMQKEIENLREIRKTYFDLFKSSKLKDEVYKREWSFQNEEEK
jgi:alkylhydroperoxidase/carboxymuconolactone decarboxylase family protein YurZ